MAEHDRKRVEVRLEVDPGSDPIKGSLRDRAGAVYDFQGWLDLMAVLDAATASGTANTEGDDR